MIASFDVRLDCHIPTESDRAAIAGPNVLDPDEECGWYIEETIEGSTIASVLSMTQWHEAEFIRLMKSQVDAAIKSDRLKPAEAIRLLNNYERALKGYTYLYFNGNGSPKAPDA